MVLFNPEMRDVIVGVSYLIAAVLFVTGLKGLTHPRTAVSGNVQSALGMLIAILVTLLEQRVVSFEWIIAGIALGTVVGAVWAIKVQMTGMPQLVALFNGFGGIASVLVATAEAWATIQSGNPLDKVTSLSIALSALIGAVTFTGSFVAFCKLQEVLIPSGAVTTVWLKGSNVILALLSLGLTICMVVAPGHLNVLWILCAVSLALGFTLVIPIGGADMPVVIALLNSYSGIAACATGFILNNNLLIITGSLVGASGIILTKIMCKAMNRSLTNVLFGGFGAVAASNVRTEDDVYAGKITSASADEAAMVLEGAQRVVIVPGYGMAVSQAQHAVCDLVDLLASRGVNVDFAIHPVAGRMPGHMNVLLAEADIPYEKMREMDDINPEFDSVDVVLVIGANDVVNPLAREDPTSPIAGMPILNVDKARTVMVIKRSLSPGFAGIPNPLFAADNTMMLFGDGKQMAVDITNALKEL